MKVIFDLLSKAFAICLIGWIVSMILTGDKCTRVQRFGLPITYFFEYVISPAAEHWASPSTKLFILQTQYKMLVTMHQVFEKTVYGVQTVKDANGNLQDAYLCSKSAPK